VLSLRRAALDVIQPDRRTTPKAAGGYGNVSSTDCLQLECYILDGFDRERSFPRTEHGLSTNLVIGLDALQEATVKYQLICGRPGRYGARRSTTSPSRDRTGFTETCTNMERLPAQRNRLLSSCQRDAGSSAKKPRSTVNEFGVSVGDRSEGQALFFAHYEGIASIPLVLEHVPSPTISNMCCNNCRGRTDPINEPCCPRSRRRSFHQKMLGLYTTR